MPAGVEAELLKEVFPKKLAAVSVDEPLRAKVGGALVAISVGKGFARLQGCSAGPSALAVLCCLAFLFSFLPIICELSFVWSNQMFYMDVVEGPRSVVR